MTITDELVGKVTGVTDAVIAGAPADAAKAVLLDGLAVMIAGHFEPGGVARRLAGYVDGLGERPAASVVGTSLRTGIASAAWVNGTACHALDFDNTWYPVSHPTSPVLSAVLAVAEARELGGADLLRALVTGMETEGRLRDASTGFRSGFGFHKPGVTGTMGAVAGVVSLLGLAEQTARHAFGIAASRCAGLALNTGSMTKATHAGHAARMGVESALLACAGITAGSDPFGPGGFFDAFAAGKAEPRLSIDGFGDPFRLVDPGVGFKRYPANYYLHRAIDAALEIRRAPGFAAQHIDSIEIDFPSLAYLNRPRPPTGLAGKFSVQYVVAIALLDGRVDLYSFSDARLNSPDVQRLLDVTQLHLDADIPDDLMAMHTDVTIICGGDRRTLRVTELRGAPGSTITREQRLEKAHLCADWLLGSAGVDMLIEQVRSVDLQSSVASLIASALAAVPATGRAGYDSIDGEY